MLSDEATTNDHPRRQGNGQGRWGDATMLNVVKRVLADEDGQDLIEYALLAAFVALAAVAAMTQLGTAINNIYTRISSTLGTAGS
jgi:pilus assembly protein Flp/PilA